MFVTVSDKTVKVMKAIPRIGLVVDAGIVCTDVLGLVRTGGRNKDLWIRMAVAVSAAGSFIRAIMLEKDMGI